MIICHTHLTITCHNYAYVLGWHLSCCKTNEILLQPLPYSLSKSARILDTTAAYLHTYVINEYYYTAHVDEG